MSKPSHKTLVTKLTQIYVPDDATEDYCWGIYKQLRAEYDRESLGAPMNWDYYLHFKTTDSNVWAHARKVANFYFSRKGYDWLLECYKQNKTKAVA